MKIMVTSFTRSCARTATLSVPDPPADHCWPLPLPETPGHSQASLGQSVVGSLLLSPGSWCAQGFVCALQESVSRSCVSSVIKSHWPPKSNSLGVLSPFSRSEGGKSVVGPRTFLTVQEFLWYNCSAICGSSAWWLYGGINSNLLQECLCHRPCDPGSVQFSCSVVSNSLRPHGLQHSSLPCPSPTPRVYSNSCPLSRWCHPAISSSVVPFSSCPQSLPASGSFLTSQFFTSGGQSMRVSASASVLLMNIQDWFPLGWTGWISLQSKGLSRVFSNTAVQKKQFFGVTSCPCNRPLLTCTSTGDSNTGVAQSVGVSASWCAQGLSTGYLPKVGPNDIFPWDFLL